MRRLLGALVAALMVAVATTAAAPRPATAAQQARDWSKPVVVGSGSDPVDVRVVDLEDAVVAGAVRGDDGQGGWFVTAAGSITAFGTATHLGDLAAIDLVEPIVAMASTPSGNGYWLAASDGGVFAFGDAPFRGSAGDIDLVEPIVAMASTPSGNGYWLAASDGGVFAFGDAPFRGSTGAIRLDQPVRAMVSTPSGGGYWLAAEDGGVFAFGDAPFLGSTGGVAPTAAVVDMIALSGDGYWLVTEAGTTVAFGTAPPPPQVQSSGTVVAAERAGSQLWLVQHPTLDVVSAWQSGGLSSRAEADIVAAAAENGAASVVSHTGTIRVLSITRRGSVVDAAAPGWQIPFTARAVDPSTAAVFVGGEVAGALDRGEVVMGRTTANLRGARPGDQVTFLGGDDVARTRTIGAVVSEGRTGAELLFGDADGRTFGLDRAASVWITGIDDADALTAALQHLESQHAYLSFGRSWDPATPDPDSVLSTLRLKVLLGEFDYRYRSGDEIEMDPRWVADNIVVTEVPIIGRIRCNRAAVDDLSAALAQVEAAGLANLIDVGDTRRNGGCWYARRIRGTSGDAISRHAWGLAVDINPASNPWGRPPTMDMRIVEIFRANGFAWGGTWTRPDGMHFEWTGRRDQSS